MEQFDSSFFVLTSNFFPDIETILDPDEGVDAFKSTRLYLDVQQFITRATDYTPIVFKLPISVITTYEPFVDAIFSEHTNRNYFSYDVNNEHLFFNSIDNLFHGLVDLIQQILEKVSPRSPLESHHFETLWYRHQMLSVSIVRIMTALDVESIADTLVDLST